MRTTRRTINNNVKEDTVGRTFEPNVIFSILLEKIIIKETMTEASVQQEEKKTILTIVLVKKSGIYVHVIKVLH